MKKKIFITGVDTDIGKTFVSVGLLLAQNKKGLKVGYFKPFQSGAYMENGTLKAPDVVEILKFLNVKTDYSYLLEGEVSPYLASKLSKTKIDFNKVMKDIDEFSSDLDLTLIEGAGGFYCPIAKGVLFSDFIKMLDIETIIVTTPSLGRLNHTLMTLDCAKKLGIKVKGLVINNFSKTPTESEQHFIEELKDFSDVKILATIQKIETKNEAEIIKAFKDVVF